jgi:hypothetical protein
MSAEIYRTDLQKLKVYDGVACSKQLMEDVNALSIVIFTGPEDKASVDSYTKQILYLMNKIKLFHLNAIDSHATMVGVSERKNGLMQFEQQRLQIIRGVYADIIQKLNAVVANQCGM